MIATSFRMKLVDVFFLEDKTVFVGKLTSGEKFLGSARCRLVIDGVDRGSFGLEGESLFRPNLESVWTRERLELSRDEIVSCDSWLIST